MKAKLAGLLLLLAYVNGCTALSDQAAAPRDNAKLAGDVAEQIFADGLMRDAKVSVQAEAGVVVLRGSARDEVHVLRIAESSATVPGVSRVENRLCLASPNEDGLKPRRNLIEAVRQALEQRLADRGGRLLVEAEEGTVYLSGIVPNARVRAAARNIALRVDGVLQVQDNLLSETP